MTGITILIVNNALEVFLLDTGNYCSSCCDRHFLFLFAVERIFGLAILIL